MWWRRTTINEPIPRGKKGIGYKVRKDNLFATIITQCQVSLDC
jgi:hypothetical protein